MFAETTTFFFHVVPGIDGLYSRGDPSMRSSLQVQAEESHFVIAFMTSDTPNLFSFMEKVV